MKVKAKVGEFNVYDLFVEFESTEVGPFGQYYLAKALNEWAERKYPDMFVEFVSPDDSGLSQWNVRFHEKRYEYGTQGVKFETYPKRRVHGERDLRRHIPAALDEVLLDLDEEELEL
jgi:hypothetical protein